MNCVNFWNDIVMEGFDKPVVQYARNHVDEEALYSTKIL